jgi:hypothetical protein
MRTYILHSTGHVKNKRDLHPLVLSHRCRICRALCRSRAFCEGSYFLGRKIFPLVAFLESLRIVIPLSSTRSELNATTRAVFRKRYSHTHKLPSTSYEELTSRIRKYGLDGPEQPGKRLATKARGAVADDELGLRYFFVDAYHSGGSLLSRGAS